VAVQIRSSFIGLKL